MDFQTYFQMAGQWLFTSGLRIVLILGLTIVAFKAARILSTKLLSIVKNKETDIEAMKRVDTLASVIRYIFTIAIFMVATMMVLRELGIEIGPILAAAGIVGLAVGFGAQNLVQDVIGGFFILLEDQIRVGDVVQIAGKAGLVERVTLRMTILRDLAGHVHYVRNGQIDVVTNMTKEFSFYVFEIGVAYRENVDEVCEVIKMVDEDVRSDPEYQSDILEPIEILGLDRFADSAIVIKARIKTLPVKQFRVGREFNRRLKKMFDERDIEIPFPHLTLYMGKDKRDQAPPLRVALNGDGELHNLLANAQKN
jgi:small conductance mechanosensitive channel